MVSKSSAMLIWWGGLLGLRLGRRRRMIALRFAALPEAFAAMGASEQGAPTGRDWYVCLCGPTRGELCKSLVLNFIRKELLETNRHLFYGLCVSAERSLPLAGSAGSVCGFRWLSRWILDFAPCRRTSFWRIGKQLTLRRGRTWSIRRRPLCTRCLWQRCSKLVPSTFWISVKLTSVANSPCGDAKKTGRRKPNWKHKRELRWIRFTTSPWGCWRTRSSPRKNDCVLCVKPKDLWTLFCGTCSGLPMTKSTCFLQKMLLRLKETGNVSEQRPTRLSGRKRCFCFETIDTMADD